MFTQLLHRGLAFIFIDYPLYLRWARMPRGGGGGTYGNGVFRPSNIYNEILGLAEEVEIFLGKGPRGAHFKFFLGGDCANQKLLGAQKIHFLPINHLMHHSFAFHCIFELYYCKNFPFNPQKIFVGLKIVKG